jgi:uncharacterized membrane protein HdeD (DUF308 family)
MPTTSLWLPITIHGLLAVLVGGLAIAVPQYAALTLEVILGVALLAVAGVSVATYRSIMLFDGAEWVLLWGIIAGFAGALVMWNPDFAAFSLAIAIATYITMHGAISIMAALEYRKFFPGIWGWVMANGIINLLLAAVIFMGLPEQSARMIGTLFGVSLIVFGCHLVMFGLAMRRLMPA